MRWRTFFALAALVAVAAGVGVMRVEHLARGLRHPAGPTKAHPPGKAHPSSKPRAAASARADLHAWRWYWPWDPHRPKAAPRKPAGRPASAPAKVAHPKAPPETVALATPRPEAGMREEAPVLAPQPDAAEYTRAIARMNAARRAAGLRPVVEDRAMSAACRLHATYLGLNAGKPQAVGLRRHQEDPALPGATKEGAVAGLNGDIAAVRPEAAVDAWLDSLFHRTPMLDPNLTKVGIGCDVRGGVVSCVLMFEPGPVRPSERYPVAFPADGQADVELGFGAPENPNPIPAGQVLEPGYPVTLAFEPFTKVRVGAASLRDARGEVACHFSSPERPAVSADYQAGVVCLIPKAPLRPDTRYDVVIEAAWKDGPMKAYRWGFRTARPLEAPADDEAAIARAIGRLARVTGTVRYVADNHMGDHALCIGGSTAEPVWVLVDTDVWDQGAGRLGDPADLVGKRVSAVGSLVRYHSPDGRLHVANVRVGDPSLLAPGD